jgi:hypothetical protein
LARLGRKEPVSLKRLQKEFAWNPETLEAVFAAAARKKVLEIASRQALPKGLLAKEAARSFRRCYSSNKIEKLVAALAREGRLRKAVAVIGPSTLYYPDGAIEPLVSAFYERLKKLGFDENEIRDARERVIGGRPDVAELAARILDQLRRLEEGPGVPVNVRRLRAAFPGVPKADFDRAVLSLAGRNQILLIEHDHGWALPEHEREILVYDGGTKLYVGVKLRH